VRYPNVYGVDMPNRKEFVAHGLTEDQVRVWCVTLGVVTHRACGGDRKRVVRVVCVWRAPKETVQALVLFYVTSMC
jgi:hypothetical protein